MNSFRNEVRVPLQALGVLRDLECKEPWMAAASFQRAVLLLSVSRWREAAGAAAAAAGSPSSNGGGELQQPASLLLALLRLCAGSEVEGAPSAVAALHKLAESFKSEVRYRVYFLLSVGVTLDTSAH